MEPQQTTFFRRRMAMKETEWVVREDERELREGKTQAKGRCEKEGAAGDAVM